MLNRTHFEHAAVALVIQIVLSLITGNVWIGAAAGAFFFIGREHSQAEDRWIEMFGAGKRNNAPFFCGLDWRVWRNQNDAWLDWVVPSVACVVLACLSNSVAGIFLTHTTVGNGSGLNIRASSCASSCASH